MNREQQKKLLILEGMMHRLEIGHALDGIKLTAKSNLLISSISPVISLLLKRKGVALLGFTLAKIACNGRASSLIRRIVLMTGLGATIALVVSRWASRHSSR
jgi:hypothetical protein